MRMRFRYGLEADSWIEPGSALWDQPLPGSSLTGAPKAEHPPTYGELFDQVARWISALGSTDAYRTQWTAGPIAQNDFPDPREPVVIRLVKHGACYHVCRVTLSSRGEKAIDLAVNVAVGPPGLSVIERDFNWMQTLYGRSADPILPKPYDFGRMVSSCGRLWALFSSEWLTGFSEFHPSFDPGKNRPSIRIWETGNEGPFLDETHERLLFRKIAYILTLLYDIQTGSEVHPWHHAAGDFVLCRNGSDLLVRLITIRGYGPLLEPQQASDHPSPWLRLLVFLCNLSIRNRLDRMDGVGQVFWSEEFVVEETIKGFWDALSVHTQKNMLSEDIAEGFREVVSALDPEMIYEICDQIVDSYPPSAPEIDTLRQHLSDHAAVLYGALNDHELVRSLPSRASQQSR